MPWLGLNDFTSKVSKRVESFTENSWVLRFNDVFLYECCQIISLTQQPKKIRLNDLNEIPAPLYTLPLYGIHTSNKIFTFYTSLMRYLPKSLYISNTHDIFRYTYKHHRFQKIPIYLKKTHLEAWKNWMRIALKKILSVFWWETFHVIQIDFEGWRMGIKPRNGTPSWKIL